MDVFSFLKNYDTFIKCVETESKPEYREEALNNLKLLKIILVSSINTVLNIKVTSPKSFFENDLLSHEESSKIQLEHMKSLSPFNPF
jgi:hypothetical protein